MAKKPSYGVDAPGVVRNLFLSGAALLAIALAFPRVTIGSVTFLLIPGFLWPAFFLLLGGALMLLYSLYGKGPHRDRMLNMIPWTGAEAVLDIGTGRGLLLIGAAKRLTSGHATGIDIWNAEDLSGNGPEALQANIALEGVTAHTTICNEDARAMSFPDASFDVVLSNLCLHNIYQKPGRAKACREIARVLKPGGVAVLSDYKHVRAYAGELKQNGLVVTLHPLNWIRTYPPLRILTARKPA